MKAMRTCSLLLFMAFSIACSKEPKQDPPTPPAAVQLNFSTDNISFPETDSGSSTFTVTCDSPWSLSVSDTKAAPTWCKVEPSWGGKGSTLVTVSIAQKNDSYDDRFAYIKIAAGKTSALVTVTQKKKNAIILTRDKFEVGEGGAELKVEVKSNIEYSVSIPKESATWISKATTAGTKGLETKALVFTIAPGSVNGAREGLIVFEGGGLIDTVHVFQCEKRALILNERECTLSCDGGSISVELRSNIEYDVIMPVGVTWVSTLDTKAMVVDNFTFAVEKNREYSRRSASIIFKDKNSNISDTLRIIQSQVNALILGKPSVEGFPFGGGVLEVGVKSNVSFSYEFLDNSDEWISVVSTKTLKESTVTFAIDVNGGYDRIGAVRVVGELGVADTLYLAQDGVKTILMEFYQATGGDNWLNNKNWGSSLPVNEWYGVNVNRSVNAHIPTGINLPNNNLNGTIPTSIGKLDNLEILTLHHNKLSGTIPKEIANLSKLRNLNIYMNNLSGAVPEGVGKPPTEWVHLNYNKLTGPLPNSLVKMGNWDRVMDYVINQTGYTLFPPKEYNKVRNIESVDLSLQPFNAFDVISNYSYTVLYSYGINCPFSNEYTGYLVDLVNKYRGKGLGAISYHACILKDPGEPDILDKIVEYTRRKEMDKFVNLLHIGEYVGEYCGPFATTSAWKDSYFLGSAGVPSVIVLDKAGTTLFGCSTPRYDLSDFFISLLGQPGNMYKSTDFSKDGQVMTLQKATVGNGVNIVIMGDGFVDKDMGSGAKYEARAKEAMEAIFSVEPTKSFRNRFNVYCVKAVSLDEGIGKGYQTAFSTGYGEGTFISGSPYKCEEYALKVPGITSVNDVTILTILNDPKHAGTCYFYTGNSSIAYCPTVGFENESFSQVVMHEVVGHGIGKLADEYYYLDSIPALQAQAYKNEYDNYGWWANVDFTNDPSKIRWKDFLTNSLYSGKVGIYEGGVTYEFGVYRPSQTSIMHNYASEFNAPSRLAIYKRIMNLSGETFSLEKFLEYDAVNRATTPPTKAITLPLNYKPLAPPVVWSR